MYCWPLSVTCSGTWSSAVMTIVTPTVMATTAELHSTPPVPEEAAASKVPGTTLPLNLQRRWEAAPFRAVPLITTRVWPSTGPRLGLTASRMGVA